MESLIALAIASIAFTKTTEQSTERLPDTTLAKISQLQELLKSRINSHKPVAVSWLDLQKFTSDLQEVMKSDSYFAAEIVNLASEIQQEISIDPIQTPDLANISGDNSQQNAAVESPTLLVPPISDLERFETIWRAIEPTSQQVAELLGLFIPNIFAWEWVKSATSLLDFLPEDIELAHNRLLELALIQPVDEREDYYEVNSCFSEFLWEKLAVSTQKEQVNRAFAETFVAIAKKIPESPTQELIKSIQDAIPHLAKVAETLIDAVKDEDLIWLFTGLGRYNKSQRLYTAAEAWRKQCVTVIESRLGEEHPDIATSYNNLAGLYEFQGRYAEAEPLFVKALAIRQRLLGEEHLAVATSYNNLAGLYKSQGRYTEAEPLYNKALAILQNLLGEEHPSVATSCNNLAGLYNSQGKYIDAEPLYIKALTLRQRLLGEDHPDVAQSYNNLAQLYYAQARYTEAESLYRKALALRQRLLGEDHPDVAQSYNNLAQLYYVQGKYTEAEPLFIQALALRKELLGEEHPDVAHSYNNLAEFYESQGSYEEAENLYKQALAIRQRLLGEDHPDVAQSYRNLAGLYTSQNRLIEAESFYDKALEIAEHSLGENHPHTVIFRENLTSLRDKLKGIS
jgi:tetratricopeptide (TPR) repeat protein